MKKITNFLINNYAILGIISLGIVCYWNSFSVPFQFDDLPYIVKNTNIHNLADFKGIWNALAHPSRFIAFVSFAINYHFSGVNVFGYHLTNLIIHISSGILIYSIISMLLNTDKVKDQYSQFEKKGIALLTSLLFICHPLQTQAVTYIVQRFASLATLFYLMSLWFYIKARISRLNWLYLGALVSCLLAMFTKQISFTLPFMILIVECLFFKNSGNIFAYFKGKMALLMVLFCFLLIVPAFSNYNFSRVFGVTVSSGNYEGDVVTAPKYLLTQFRVIPTYLRLFVLPINQSIDYQFPLSQSLWELKTLAGLIFLSGLFFLGLFLLQRNILLGFGILWFFVTLSVESSVIPIHHVIYEHRCYLPSVGVFLVLSVLIFKLIKNRQFLYGLIVILVVSLTFLTVKRNVVWQDKVSLWENALKTAPGQFKVHDNLGFEYWKSGKFEEALKHFNTAIKINPAYPGVYNNRGGMYADQELYDLAIADFNRALLLKPNFSDAYYNLGKVHHDMQKLEQSLSYYNQAIDVNPEYAEAYNNRGNVNGELDRFEDALYDFNMAIKYDPKQAHTYYHRAFTYKKLGDVGQALEDYSKAIKLNPEYAEAYNNRGNIYFSNKDLDKAMADYTNAIKYDEDLVKAYYSRGLIYKERRDLIAAYNDFSKVIEKEPENGVAYFQRSLILSALKENQQSLNDALKSQQLGYPIDANYLNYLKSQL